MDENIKNELTDIKEEQVQWPHANVPPEIWCNTPRMKEYIHWLKKQKELKKKTYPPLDSNGVGCVNSKQIGKVLLDSGEEPRIVTFDKENNVVEIHINDGNNEPFWFSEKTFKTDSDALYRIEEIIEKEWCTRKILHDLIAVYHEIKNEGVSK